MENDFRAPQTLVDLWRVQTQIAYDLYQLAKEAVHEADEERAAAPQPGGFVLIRALRIERAALAEYKRVLRIFTDLLIDGKLRDHKAAKVACSPNTGLTKNSPARKNRRTTSAKSSASC